MVINNNNVNYSADQITVLEGLEAVRKHPSMYIGDINQRGLHHLVYEVVDNSIDEALAGYAKNIKVYVHKDNSITVMDDGRGIPVDIHKGEGKPAIEVVLTMLHAGGKFDHDVYKVSGGLHGVGISCVNALSEWMEVKVHRNGFIYYMKFERGNVIKKLCRLGTTDQNGTIIKFKPDSSIFKVTEYSWNILTNRLKELAYLNNGIHLSLIDERDDLNQEINFYYEDGIKEFVLDINANKAKLHNEIIYAHKNKDDIDVKIALQYNEGFSETILCYANNINTIEGGTHLTGFQSALTRTLNNYARSNGFIKDNKNMSGSDVREGLVAVVSVKLFDPQFEGQTKTKLGNSEVRSIVESIVSESIEYFLEENPAVSRVIINKVLTAARAREAAKKARELIQYKSIFDSISLPGKLSDCSIKDPELCELYIVEGDSAGGSAKQGRDSSFQAILPIRGKLINVEKARIDKVLDNKEIQSIISVLGCGISKDEFDISKLRYNKVILMTDADVDGLHIKTLILTFLFRYMRGLIENGNIYIAKPPLFRIKYGHNQYEYIEDERQLDIHLIKYGCMNLTIHNLLNNYIFDEDSISKLLKILNMICDINLSFRKYNIEPSYYISQINKNSLLPISRLVCRNNDGESCEMFIYSENDKKYILDGINNNYHFEDKYSFLNNIDDISDIVFTDIYENKRIKDLIKLSIDCNLYDELMQKKDCEMFKVVNNKTNETINVNSIFNLFNIIRNIGNNNANIQRYKGLGEMNADQLWDTTMCPDTRSMIKVTMEDAIESEKMFSLLMGEEVEPRRKYIEKHASGILDLDI